MKKLIPIRDIISTTFQAYKKNWNRMQGILAVIFAINIIPIVAQAFLDYNNGALEAFLTMSLGSSSIGLVFGILLFLLFLVGYIALIVVGIILSAGFFNRIADLEHNSLQLKEIWKSGKKLFKPTLWLSVYLFFIGLALVMIFFGPVALVSFGAISLGSYIAALTPVSILVSIILFVAATIGIGFAGLHLSFSQLALYVDEKKGFDAIKHSVQIVQGNIWGLLARIFVYYVGFFLIFSFVAIILGVTQELIIRSAYNLEDTQSVLQLYELRVAGVVVVEALVSIIMSVLSIFVMLPFTAIASIILYRNLQEVQRQNESDGEEKEIEGQIIKRDLSLYIPRLYSWGKVSLIGIIIFVIIMIILGVIM